MNERACGSCAWFDASRGAEFGTCRESPAQVYVDHNGNTRWEQPRMHVKSWCSRFASSHTNP